MAIIRSTTPAQQARLQNRGGRRNEMRGFLLPYAGKTRRQIRAHVARMRPAKQKTVLADLIIAMRDIAKQVMEND